MQNVEVSLSRAEATFDLKPGKKLEPQVLRKAVKDAGFTPREIFITARGQVNDENGKLIFRPASASQVFSLIDNQELKSLKDEGLGKTELVAKVVGEEPPLPLEIQKYAK